MKYDHKWIRAHIPHSGKMCLLDKVQKWNEESITCTTMTHISKDNPMKNNNKLGISSGVEYAAQAMAVHNAILFEETENVHPRGGVITRVQNIQFFTDYLDEHCSALIIMAHRMRAIEDVVHYSFSIFCEEKILISGEVTVVLNRLSI